MTHPVSEPASASAARDEAAEIEELRRRVAALGPQHDIEGRLRTVLREQPILALAGALVAGFVLGRLISRA